MINFPFQKTKPINKGTIHIDVDSDSAKSSSKSRVTSRFDKKKQKKKLSVILAEFLEKLGYENSPRVLNKRIIKVDIVILIILSISLILFALFAHSPFSVVLLFLIAIWTIVFATIYILSILAVLVYLDVRLFQRTRQIEEALADYLQLTASNISAGMTVDRALWYAVRPKFGILAVEMENIAKATLTGEDLEKALIKLTKKYDSRILRESINLLIAGMRSGGEMGTLLSKIASNIKETQLLRKEVSASVMTYVIFIAAATIIAAPILFALSTELLIIIKSITSNIHMDKGTGMTALFSFNFSGDSISVDSFKSFSFIVLIISSFFSAAITSTIQKGNVKDGLKMIPIFIGVSIVLYILFTTMFATLLGSLFAA